MVSCGIILTARTRLKSPLYGEWRLPWRWSRLTPVNAQAHAEEPLARDIRGPPLYPEGWD